MSSTEIEYQPSNEDLCRLREWIKKTPYIVPDYDDEFLKAVVRKCKGSFLATQTVLKNLNALGARHPNYFGHLDIFNEVTQEHLNSVHLFVMPKRAEDGSLICIISVDSEQIDPYKFHLFEQYRYGLMSFYALVWEKMFESGKIIVIFDWKNLSGIHLREATPVHLRKSAEIIGEYYPFRIQAIHHVNVPAIMEWIINTFKSFAKKKILNRFHVHRSAETLVDFIPAKYLSKDYGGEQESSASLHRQWKKKVESYAKELIAESDKMRNLDSIRPKRDDVNEMEGTFKALQVD